MPVKKLLKKIAATFSSAQGEELYMLKSFSQEGEDLVLRRFFADKENGFFVDVGAHHPVRFSNTWYFYNRGWRGINIDAMPGSMQAFREQRPGDINLEMGIAQSPGKMKYYIFNEPALNTFSETEAAKKDGLKHYKIIREVELEVKPLSEVLDIYLPEGKKIDFLSIDVEGLDEQVLLSNNWDKYVPEMILIESLNQTLENLHSLSGYRFLKSKGYVLIAKTYNTLFFKKQA